MAYIQKVNVPPNKIYTLSLKDFSGGLNNRSDLLQPNQASRLLNMTFKDDADMEKRFGSIPFNATVLPYPVTFVHEFRPYTDGDKIVTCDNHNLYMDGTSICTVAGQVDAVNFQGKYFFVDTNKYRVYGKFPQTTTTFERIVGTAINEYMVMEVVNPPSGYTPLGTTYTRGVTAYDYTNKKVWYEPCQNEMNDAYLNGNVIPETPSFIESLNGRLYLSGNSKDDDSVYLTHVNNPYYVPATLGLQVPPNSDKIRGLTVFDDSVVVGREEELYRITGKTNNPNLGFELFQVKKLNSHTGFANNQAVTVAHNYLFFLGNDGNAYSLSTVNVDSKTLATSILTKTVDLFAEPFNLTRSDIRTATAYFHQDLWYVSIQNFIFVYSYRLQAWTIFDSLLARSFYEINDELVWGNESGKVMTFSTNYLDDGNPYVAYWSSSRFDMGEPTTFKQFRDFFLIAHTFKDFQSDIYMTFEVDYTDVDSEAVISNQLSIWGKSVFGDRFINRNINASHPFTIGRRGRSIRFTFRNGYKIIGHVDTVADLETVLGKVDGETLYRVNGTDLYLYKNSQWNLLTSEQVNQPMRIYQVNGDYEFRGKR